MKYYILRLNQMHKKKLRCTTTSLGKHFALASQNLEYKMPELFLSYWGKKGAVEKNTHFQRYFTSF